MTYYKTPQGRTRSVTGILDETISHRSREKFLAWFLIGLFLGGFWAVLWFLVRDLIA